KVQLEHIHPPVWRRIQVPADYTFRDLHVALQDASEFASASRSLVRGEARTMFDRITFDPQIMGGRACIRGMRIPVSVVVGQIAHGVSFDEVLVGYPDLERQDIEEALRYAAWLAQEQVKLGSARVG